MLEHTGVALDGAMGSRAAFLLDEEGDHGAFPANEVLLWEGKSGCMGHGGLQFRVQTVTMFPRGPDKASSRYLRRGGHPPKETPLTAEGFSKCVALTGTKPGHGLGGADAALGEELICSYLPIAGKGPQEIRDLGGRETWRIVLKERAETYHTLL